MASFFLSQLDFIFFFYGFAFILLGATCMAIARIGGRRESWSVLALFAFLHGGGEWLDLTAMVAGDAPGFALFRTALMTVSFLWLIEFARREAVRAGMTVFGIWIYAPILSLVVAGWAIGGVNAANAIARYAVGFTGATATSIVLFGFARGFTSTTRKFALCAAAGFALYALAAGAVVPTAWFWPASAFNQDWFAHVTGTPIQLVRGVLACGISFAVWAVWGEQLIVEVASSRYTRFLRRQFVWTLVAMTAILVVGWLLTEFLGGVYKENVEKSAQGNADLLVSRMTGELAAVDGMVKALAGSPSMVGFLGGAGDPASTALDRDAAAAGAKGGFILDNGGGVVATSHPPSSTEIIHDQAMADIRSANAGDAGHHFVFDPSTSEVDYYTSYPVRDDRGAILGTAVLEKSLNAFAGDLRQFDHPYFFIGPDGVVVMTNRPQFILRPLWPLSNGTSSAARMRLARLDGKPIMAEEVADASWTNLGQERTFLRRRFIDDTGWSLVILSPIQQIYASRVLGIVVTLLIALMTLIYLFGRERWFHDTVQMENRLKLQELARDLRFQATTDRLTGLYNRLKFDEALAGEILRSVRYQTPLALILYDVDQFKIINDTHGHQTGDKVLTELSSLVAANIRTVDVLARWGGEEFVVMLPGCDGAMACQAGEKLRDAIERTVFAEAGTATCSFGVAEYCAGDTAASLIARADQALYRAKLNGRNRVERAPSPDMSDLASVA